MEQLGADVRLAGSDFDEAKAEAERFAAEEGVLFVDGLEREQYEGYSAIAEEILEQATETPSAVVVPVGNGALMGGIGMGICRRAPEVERIGVVARAAPCMALSWEAGKPVECDSAATFADGLAVRVAIPVALEEHACVRGQRYGFPGEFGRDHGRDLLHKALQRPIPGPLHLGRDPGQRHDRAELGPPAGVLERGDVVLHAVHVGRQRRGAQQAHGPVRVDEPAAGPRGGRDQEREQNPGDDRRNASHVHPLSFGNAGRLDGRAESNCSHGKRRPFGRSLSAEVRPAAQTTEIRYRYGGREGDQAAGAEPWGDPATTREVRAWPPAAAAFAPWSR